MERGNLDMAEEKLTAALDNAKEISLYVLLESCLVSIIQLRLRTGLYHEGLHHAQELRCMIEQESGLFLFMGPCCILEGENYLRLGRLSEAMECLQTSMKYCVPYWRGYLYRVLGDYYKSLDTADFEISESYYQKAIESHSSLGMNLEMARDLYAYGKMLKRRGNKAKSQRLFEKALEIFRSFDAQWDIHQAQRAIGNI
jgi:tetratricopeptide (TPR) repeat protein